nr:EOG090X0BI6 [Moina brachiata]
MGRTIIVEDRLEHYIGAVASKKEYAIGLIFGQEISSQKSCVIHLARTPDRSSDEDEEIEEDDPVQTNGAKIKEIKDDFDEELVLDHARQVMRSLPGGITILGVFVVSDTEPFQNSAINNRLRKLLTSIDLIVGKSCMTIRHQLTCERIALHVCNVTLKHTCKTVDIASAMSSTKPADWKYTNAAGSPWLELHCTLNVEFFVGLSDSESSGALSTQLEAAIDIYGKAVKNCICLFDGRIIPDSELLDCSPAEKGSGRKKNKHSEIEERMKSIAIQPEVKQKKHEVTSDLRFGGQMCIKAYVHGKATVREACDVIKEDVLRTLWARCDMHCDSLIGEEQRGKPDVRAVLHEPPRRVLAPLPFSPVSVSDYLFPGEGPADSLASLADLLDLGALLEGDVQDYWEAAAEVSDAVPEQESALLETSAASKRAVAAGSSNSRAILLSALVALLAILFSYLTLQILRSN